jgi:bis(5'-nucleosyl)-tetraphosphatase (symmetrical)
MALYAVGDVQGCYDALRQLLDRIAFDPARDRLWFTGDLVNRGAQSLETLRFVRSLGAAAVTVLGNHDLHLLAVASGKARARRRDTLDEVLRAPDRGELLTWLRERPLLHHDRRDGAALVHAGLLPGWSIERAAALARETEAMLRGPDAEEFFGHMYGDLPDRWTDQLRGVDRARLIVNAFTRLRYCDLDGALDLHHKGAPGSQPPDLVPWYAVPGRHNRDQRIVFGHWSTLGVYTGENVIGIDSGCLWGGHLTAVRLDSGEPEFTQVTCVVAQHPTT